MWAASAEAVTWGDGVVIHEGQPQTVDAVLSFDGAVPRLFTLTLDFGEDGLGPVLVVPD